MKIKENKGLLPLGLLEEPVSKSVIKSKAQQETQILLEEKTPLEVFAVAHVATEYIGQVMENVKTFATEQAMALLEDGRKSYDLPNGVKVTVATTKEEKYDFNKHEEWVKANERVQALELELKIAKAELKAIELSIAAVEEPLSKNERKTLKLSY